jgi:hypothetical protein
MQNIKLAFKLRDGSGLEKNYYMYIAVWSRKQQSIYTN